MAIKRRRYDGNSASAAGLDYLLRKAARLDSELPAERSSDDEYRFKGPIERDFLITASDSRPKLIAVSDYKCSGTEDELEWNRALLNAAAVGSGGGAEVSVAAGTYAFADGSTITVPVGVGLVGPHWRNKTGVSVYGLRIVPAGDVTFVVNGYMEWISLGADVGS